MVKDIAPGSDGSDPAAIADVNGVLYFVANDGFHGLELWRSDGTPEGTGLVRDINPGANAPFTVYGYLVKLIAVGGSIFFVADDGVHGAEVWRSDGTEAGTVLVEDIRPGPDSSYPTSLLELNGSLYFTADDGSRSLVWKSDGTAAGTEPLEALDPGGAYRWASNLTQAGHRLYFQGFTGNTGVELWKSDGTDVGTVLVKDITRLVKNIAAGTDTSRARSFMEVGGIGYLVANDKLWQTDGTEAGTRPVREGQTGLEALYADGLTDLGGTVYFGAYDQTYGDSLWSSDGTPTGTRRLDDVFSSSPWDDSAFGGLARVGDRLYFGVYKSTLPSFELWQTDGSPSGTTLIREFSPVDPRSSWLFSYRAATSDGTLYFFLDPEIGGIELWKSNGTPAGTQSVKDFSPESVGLDLTIGKGSVYFTATDDIHGRELWKSDGTEQGTTMVADVFPGGGFSWPRLLVDVNGTLYFTADDGAHGEELWKSDGSEEGTMLVKDIAPGSNSSRPTDLTDVNGTLYFVAQDPANGRELWKTDGTEAGTVVVRDIVPGNGSSFPSALVNANGTLYFSATDGINGLELWKSDGTAAGTKLFADIMPGADSSSPEVLTAVGQSLIFTATDGRTGREPWILPLVVPPWQNPDNRFDVNGDTRTEPVDVLTLINYINAHPGQITLPPRPTGYALFCDVSGDNAATALDVLILINYLNSLSSEAGEAEPPEAFVAVAAPGDASESPYDGSGILAASVGHRTGSSSSRPAVARVDLRRAPPVARGDATARQRPAATQPRSTAADVSLLDLVAMEQTLNDISGDIARVWFARGVVPAS
jgi:ELWxxDGT repeat protein